MMTKANLYQCGVLPITCDLFDNRHIRHTDKVTGEPLFKSCTSLDVIAAHANLNLLDKPWPTQAEAPTQTQQIQIELDRLLRKH